MIVWLLAVAWAHVPNIASYTLVEGEQAWTLDVALPTDGMHAALQGMHPTETLSAVSVAVYEGYLTAALREGVSLRYDGRPVVLGEAVVGLAAHETHVRFAVPAPGAALVVEAQIDAFSGLGHQQNVFRVVGAGQRAHVVLTEHNGFVGALVLPGLPESLR